MEKGIPAATNFLRLSVPFRAVVSKQNILAQPVSLNSKDLMFEVKLAEVNWPKWCIIFGQWKQIHYCPTSMYFDAPSFPYDCRYEWCEKIF